MPNATPLILIVEDDRSKRLVTSGLMTKAGYAVLEAETGQEALTLARQQKPDLVILDINLPDFDGFEVCRRLKADGSTADISVLYLTAMRLSTRDKVEGLEGGGDAYLTFPIDTPELLATVRVLLRLRQALQNQQQETRHWQTTFDAIADPIVLLDLEGRVTRTNRAFRQLTGKQEAELQGCFCYSLIHNADCFIADCPFLRARNTRQRAELEMQVGDRWYRVKVDPVIDPKGVLSHFVHVMVDITARRQSEITLQESQMRYRTFIDASTSFIFVKDENLRYLIVNQALAGYFGLPPAAVIGRCDAELLTRPVADECRLSDQQVIDTRGPIVVEQVIGNAIYHVTKFPVPLAESRIGVGGIIRDVTGRKQQELEILRNSARLKCLVNILQHPADNIQEFLDFALNEAIILAHSRFGYIYFYHEAEQVFELNTWSRGVMEACAVTEPQTRYDLAQTGIWGEAVRQRRPIVVNDFSSPQALKKGYPEGHVALTSFLTIPVFSHDRIVAVVGMANKAEKYDDEDILQLTLLMNTVWKVLEQHQARTENQLLQQQLLQAQKMESIGRLASGVAHDFNNQLSVILGYVQLAAMKLPPQSPVYEDLNEVQIAAGRAGELTRQLLAFARQQVASPQTLNLNATIDGMLKMLRRLIHEDIDLQWKPGTDLWPVRLDPSQADQILANLAVNARDAIHGAGWLTITTANISLDPGECLLRLELAPGDYVLLTVSDSGAGIPPDVRDKIFEPFFTTKELGQGTGLGLSIVYGIVRQNKGSISVYSEVGQGTTFRIYLPRERRGEVEQAAKTEEPLPLGGFETILLVEDEKPLLDLTRAMLAQIGYTVLAASSPRAALELAQNHPEAIHLLLTDLILPEMHGHQLQEEIQAGHPNIRVLYMSGYPSQVIACQGILQPDAHFLSKPFAVTALAAKVREVLGR